MEARTPLQRPQALVVGGFGLGQIAAFASSFYLMGVLGDAVGRDLGLSPTFVFSMVSLSLAVPAFIAPRVARRIDERGGKQVLLASHVVLALGLVIVGVAKDGVGLAAGMAVIGGLGSVVGWPLTAWMAEQLGWRGAHFAWAAVQILVCLPLTAWVCPPTPGHGPRAAALHADVRWDRPMIQLAVLFACAWFISTCMSAHLPRLLGAFGLTPQAAAAAAGLMGVSP